jgi:hypothetical protein
MCVYIFSICACECMWLVCIQCSSKCPSSESAHVTGHVLFNICILSNLDITLWLEYCAAFTSNNLKRHFNKSFEFSNRRTCHAFNQQCPGPAIFGELLWSGPRDLSTIPLSHCSGTVAMSQYVSDCAFKLLSSTELWLWYFEVEDSQPRTSEVELSFDYPGCLVRRRTLYDDSPRLKNKWISGKFMAFTESAAHWFPGGPDLVKYSIWSCHQGRMIVSNTNKWFVPRELQDLWKSAAETPCAALTCDTSHGSMRLCAHVTSHVGLLLPSCCQRIYWICTVLKKLTWNGIMTS